MSQEKQLPSDQRSRDLAESDISKPMVLVAGAGSGKTTTMVKRIIRSSMEGISLSDQVTITFTVKAAYELRTKLRKELNARNDLRSRDQLQLIPSMRIGTIDSIVQRILEENAVEAGLPAGFKILTDASLADHFANWFNGRIEQWRQDPSLESAWQTIQKLEIKNRQLEKMLKDLALYIIKRGKDAALVSREHELENQIVDTKNLIVQYSEEVESFGSENLTNKSRSILGEVKNFIDQLQSDADAEFNVDIKLGNNGGQVAKSYRDNIKALGAKAQALKLATDYARIFPLLNQVCQDANLLLLQFDSEGILDYNRALLRAIHMLESKSAIREQIQSTISAVMIDEFQDTNPEQVRFKKLLCGSSTAWFVVGDPKQSIYRFRGADLNGFLKFQQEAYDKGVTIGSLNANFRSCQAILELVDSSLKDAFDTDESFEYESLEAMTEGQETVLSHAWIVANPTEQDAEGVKETEGQVVVGSILLAMKEQWHVRDKENSKVVSRPIQLSDIAILYRSGSNLKTLTKYLEAARIPFRIESDIDVLDQDEVRAVVNLLRAATRIPGKDQEDSIKISNVAAMRSLSMLASLNDLQNPQQRKLLESKIEQLRDELVGMSPSQAVSKVIRDYNLESIIPLASRPRSVLNRFRTLLDRAMAMESEGICSVRKFVDILDAGDINLNESPAPEEDELAVRLMTAHSSKGLEFPMVIVTGFAGKPHQVTGPLENNSGDLFVKFKDVQPIGFEELSENEKIQEEKEAMRLLYVAMTRAKDHLIVNASTHKTSNKLMKDHIKPKANAEALGKILSYSDQTWPQNENTFKCENNFDLQRWNQVVQAENRTTPTQLAHATDLMAGKLFPEEEFNNLESIDSQEVTEDGPTTRPTAKEAVHFGRAVHLALQTIDFRNPDLNAVSEIASTLFRSDRDRLKEFVHRALSTSVLPEAATSGNNLWREVYVATVRDDNQLLEGIVDLVYERSDGTLTVVDYKTDKVSNQAEADERMERSYKKQGAAYRELLSGATGKEVSTVSFIFLNLNPPYVCEVNS